MAVVHDTVQNLKQIGQYAAEMLPKTDFQYGSRPPF